MAPEMHARYTCSQLSKQRPQRQRYMPHGARQSQLRPDGAGIAHACICRFHIERVYQSRETRNSRRGRTLREAVTPTTTVTPQPPASSRSHSGAHAGAEFTTRRRGIYYTQARNLLHGAPSLAAPCCSTLAADVMVRSANAAGDGAGQLAPLRQRLRACPTSYFFLASASHSSWNSA